jgi:hypothetical protein
MGLGQNREYVSLASFLFGFDGFLYAFCFNFFRFCGFLAAFLVSDILVFSLI